MTPAAVGIPQARLRRAGGRGPGRPRTDDRCPRQLVTFLLILPALIILLLQPDVGQTGLLLALWGAMLFFNGVLVHLDRRTGRRQRGLGVAAYVIFSDMCIIASTSSSAPADSGYQTGLALKAFAHGGLAGVGPGAGTIKYRIPDAHSDFIFAVAGEEFGLVLCGVDRAAVLRSHACGCCCARRSARDRFRQLAGAGLAMVVGAAGLHQYGRGGQPAAGERHDLAVHLLWRLVACSPWR